MSGTPKLTPATPRPSPWTPRPSPLTPHARTPFDEAESSSTPDTWEGVCEWVLGGALDLWQQLFEGPFLQVRLQLRGALPVQMNAVHAWFGVWAEWLIRTCA